MLFETNSNVLCPYGKWKFPSSFISSGWRLRSASHLAKLPNYRICFYLRRQELINHILIWYFTQSTWICAGLAPRKGSRNPIYIPLEHQIRNNQNQSTMCKFPQGLANPLDGTLPTYLIINMRMCFMSLRRIKQYLILAILTVNMNKSSL